MKLRVLMVVVALVVAGSGLAYAQPIDVKVGFAFTVGTKELPAGTYTIEKPAPNVVVIRGAGGVSVNMAELTQLGRHDKDKDAELVFDKIGGKFLLSEIWIPGKDGMLILATKEAHEHAVVGGSNPRK